MKYPTVPFSDSWIASDKVDAKAIYRRPHRHAITGDVVRDAIGAIQYDYVALSVRNHNEWSGKGFDYVTIADAESLGMVAGQLRGMGLDPRSFIMDPRTNSPWNAAKFLEEAHQDAQDEHARLRSMVEKYGVEATEEILKITLPDELRALAPKAPKADKVAKAGAAA